MKNVKNRQMAMIWNLKTNFQVNYNTSTQMSIAKIQSDPAIQIFREQILTNR